MNPEDAIKLSDCTFFCDGVPVSGDIGEVTCGESENKKPLFTPQTITLTGKIDSVFDHVYHSHYIRDQYWGGTLHHNAFLITYDDVNRRMGYALHNQVLSHYVRNLSRRVSLRRRIIAGMTPRPYTQLDMGWAVGLYPSS